jgi:methionine sulfoxide reductase heme-binding subunit
MTTTTNHLPLHLSPARFRRHFVLATIAIASTSLLIWLFGFSTELWVDMPHRKADMLEWRLSMALAYTAILFLAITLTVGPIAVFRKRPLSKNTYLRRDIGIWTGILALSHMIFGISIHTDGLAIASLWVMDMNMTGYILPLQGGWFGLANFAGLFQALLIALLLCISNDIMMRRLGMTKWKNLQRLTYLVVLSILIHGIAYQRVENRDLIIRGVFLFIMGSIILMQATALLTVIRRKSSKEGSA